MPLGAIRERVVARLMHHAGGVLPGLTFRTDDVRSLRGHLECRVMALLQRIEESEVAMSSGVVIVDGVVPARGFKSNVRDEVWSYALDQRAFGPGRLLVPFADRRGTFRAMAHCRRTEPFIDG